MVGSLPVMDLDTISQLVSNWDMQTIGGSSVAAALAGVWYFARVIRKLVSILFSLCVLYLLLRWGGVDMNALLAGWMH